MSEQQQGQSKFLRNLAIFAIIVVAISIVSPATMGTIMSAISERWRKYQDSLEEERGRAEARRKLKVSVEALEAELDRVQTQASLELIRVDVVIVRNRAQQIRQRFLAIEARADPVYANRTDNDGVGYAALKSYGPPQEKALEDFLDLIDRAERGIQAAKDSTEYLPMLRKIARVNHQEFLKQHMGNILLSRLEKQFGHP